MATTIHCHDTSMQCVHELYIYACLLFEACTRQLQSAFRTGAGSSSLLGTLDMFGRGSMRSAEAIAQLVA